MSTGSINRLPLGLLGFLGIKNGGQYPQVLADILAPTWDLTDLYYGTNFSIERYTPVNITAVGINIFGTVPNNEVWAVSAVQLNSNAVLGAGVTLAGYACAAIPNGVAYNIIPLSGRDSATTGQVFDSSRSAPGYKILPPGATLGAYCTQIVAGPVACALSLNFARMLA